MQQNTKSRKRQLRMQIFNILKPNPFVVGMSATGIGAGLLYTTYRKRYSAPPRNAKYWKEKWKKDKKPGWDPGALSSG